METGVFCIDARAMLPPEPFEQTMAALEDLDSGAVQRIELLLYREPFPLYRVLESNGYRHETHLEEDGTFVISIRVSGDRDA